MVDQKNVLTKCLLFLEKCPWNGTWVKPFHSGNVHRDGFLAKLETTVQRNSQMISP
jgi:G:T-mismatch repair DNA endonuclease (very short patch repair protein)